MDRTSSTQIANFFLQKAEVESSDITTIKLVKLAYIAQGWALAALERDILGEEVEAWKYGPVIPSIYHGFKHFGSSPITSFATEFVLNGIDSEEERPTLEVVVPRINEKDSDLANMLSVVWNTYKQYSGFDLVEMTHEKNTPWSNVYRDGERHTPIPQSSIKEYYRDHIVELVQEAQINAAG